MKHRNQIYVVYCKLPSYVDKYRNKVKNNCKFNLINSLLENCFSKDFHNDTCCRSKSPYITEHSILSNAKLSFHCFVHSYFICISGLLKHLLILSHSNTQTNETVTKTNTASATGPIMWSFIYCWCFYWIFK